MNHSLGFGRGSGSLLILESECGPKYDQNFRPNIGRGVNNDAIVEKT